MQIPFNDGSKQTHRQTNILSDHKQQQNEFSPKKDMPMFSQFPMNLTLNGFIVLVSKVWTCICFLFNRQVRAVSIASFPKNSYIASLFVWIEQHFNLNFRFFSSIFLLFIVFLALDVATTPFSLCSISRWSMIYSHWRRCLGTGLAWFNAKRWS